MNRNTNTVNILDRPLGRGSRYVGRLDPEFYPKWPLMRSQIDRRPVRQSFLLLFALFGDGTISSEPCRQY